MSERNIKIQPFTKIDNIFELKGRVFFQDLGINIEIPETKNLILFNYSYSDGKILPRDHESFEIILTPCFIKGRSYNDLNYLISKRESIENTLLLRVQVWSKKSRWCSNQAKIPMNEINGKREIKFLIPLSEISEDVIISGFVTREIDNNNCEIGKAKAALTIVSECEEIVIQVDEKQVIGGNHLPILPEDIGNKIFDIHGLDNDFDLPVIKYSNEFKDYFNRDNLNSVTITFMMSMFYFWDTYLKWLIFRCNYDEREKKHNALVLAISKYCSVSKADLVEIIQYDKFSKNQTMQYLTLSQKLFIGIQSNSSVNYLKELKQMIKNEMK